MNAYVTRFMFDAQDYYMKRESRVIHAKDRGRIKYLCDFVS